MKPKIKNRYIGIRYGKKTFFTIDLVDAIEIVTKESRAKIKKNMMNGAVDLYLDAK